MRMFLVFILVLFTRISLAQINVELLHQLVAENKSEHERQLSVRDNQALVSGNELINRSFMSKWKNIYRDIQSRFSTVSLLLSTAQISLQSAPLIEDIISDQEKIVMLCKDSPLLIAIAVNSEIDLAQQAEGLVRYLYALVLSEGDLTQMKSSERKILFAHILNELRRIRGTSSTLVSSLVHAKVNAAKSVLSPFNRFLNRDISLAGDIVTKIKILK